MELVGNKDEYKFYDEKSFAELTRCNWAQDAQFMKEEDYKSWYDDPICLKKQENLAMRSSWW